MNDLMPGRSAKRRVQRKRAEIQLLIQNAMDRFERERQFNDRVIHGFQVRSLLLMYRSMLEDPTDKRFNLVGKNRELADVGLQRELFQMIAEKHKVEVALSVIQLVIEEVDQANSLDKH
jgi:hypothetical protein